MCKNSYHQCKIKIYNKVMNKDNKNKPINKSTINTVKDKFQLNNQ